MQIIVKEGPKEEIVKCNSCGKKAKKLRGEKPPYYCPDCLWEDRGNLSS